MKKVSLLNVHIGGQSLGCFGLHGEDIQTLWGHCGQQSYQEVQVRRGGGTRRPEIAEQRGLAGMLGLMIFWGYAEANPLTVWYASTNVLHLMPAITGSQWRAVSRGVTWEYLES